MKAKLNLDQFADVSKVTEENRSKLKFKPGKRADGTLVPIAYFPEGAIFENELGLQLCRTGQASPADDECAAALGLSTTEIGCLQIEYKMTNLGINKKEDRELYRAGVIAGYDKDLNYIHGPNWDEYQAALQAVEDEEDVE